MLAEMDLLWLRSQAKAKTKPATVLPVEEAGGERQKPQGQEQGDEGEEDSDKGFIETLESWDQLDEEHENQIAEEGKLNVMSQYSQLGRVSTMSWLLNNDVDA